MHFLRSNFIGVCQSCGIVSVMTAPAPEVDSEIPIKTREMLGISKFKGYQVETLKAVCLNICDTLASVLTGSPKFPEPRPFLCQMRR